MVRALDCGESHENDAYVISEAIRVSKDPRAKYVIHEARMWSNYASKGIPAYTWRTYTGPAPTVTTSTFQAIPDMTMRRASGALHKEEGHRWGTGRNRAIR